MAIKHTFVSAVIDESNADEVGPDEWNEDHTIEDNTISAAKLSFPVATQAELDAHEAAANPHPVYTTDAEATSLAAAEVTDHEAAADPHPDYALESALTTVVKTDQANTYTTGAQSFAAASSLLVPAAAAYAPTADGSIGYATTQDHYVAGGAGALTGSFPRVLSVTRPNETKSNSTTADQDYTSVFTIPANYLIAQKVLWLTCDFTFTSDSSASSQSFYIKLGATKVFTMGTNTPGSNQTRGYNCSFFIFGTAAAGASVAVDITPSSAGFLGSPNSTANNQTASQNLATNGALNIVPGMAFGTGSNGESLTLRNVIVMEFN
jgi:hypothetical protein